MSKDFSRRRFIKSAASLSVAGAIAGSLDLQAAAARKPNVIFILADDMGYGDLSCYGRREYETPNINKLAKQGVRLTQAYSNSSVCTPTRVAFTTGRYQQRLPVGLEEPLAASKTIGTRVGLPPEHPTIASLLQGNGYRTALIGKWHLGYLPKYSPLKSGYQEFFGIMSGGVDYFTHKDTSGEPDLFEDEVPVERVGYLTDLITERAVGYLRQRANDKSPFYLSLFYTAPHWPWEGPEDEAASKALKSLQHRDGGSLLTYAEMVTRLDAGIGRVLAQLERSGLDDNTLVVFGSDNGGERFSYLWPFSGQKGDLWEGGVRVPAIARWPGVLPRNQVSEQVAITMDWTATFLSATGTAPHASYPLDGIDLLPILTGKQSLQSRQLAWRMKGQGGQAALRDANLKYLRIGNTDYLFDVLADPRERANLAELRPQDLVRLKQSYAKWEADVLPYTETGNVGVG
ncbi:MAG: sulfatase-like hydrolase/transferase [Steroidobacteraceae bacterium]